MKFILSCFVLSFSLLSKAQVFPFQDLFFWSNQMIKEHEVKQIDGYEFDYLKDSTLSDSIIVLGMHQTQEQFDSLGRIQQKLNYYPYSDAGIKKRVIHYNSNGLVKSYFHYTKENLIRSEFYDWKNDQLETWSIQIPKENGFKIFKKEIAYNKENKTVLEILKQKNKTLSRDTVMYFYTEHCTAKVKKKLSGEVIDSLVHYKTTGDTLLKKEIYQNKKLIYRELVWVFNNIKTQRIEEYQSNEFYRVYYRRSKNGKVFNERQIHLIPNLNYEKIYFYGTDGLPVKKEIYRNEPEPETVIYYIVKQR